MAGRGAAPKDPDKRIGKHAPIRGEWQPSPGRGWQHGPIPAPPDGLNADALAAWQTWMQSWFASHWTPDDLPGLVLVALLYSQMRDYHGDPYVEKKVRGKDEYAFVLRPNPATELRQMMDNYGITPKGQQDRRWQAPKDDAPAVSAATPEVAGPYAGLRVVNE